MEKIKKFVLDDITKQLLIYGNFDERLLQPIIYRLTTIVEKGCGSGIVPSLLVMEECGNFFNEYKEEIGEIITETIALSEYSSLDKIFPEFEESDPLCLGLQNQTTLAWYSYEKACQELVDEVDITIIDTLRNEYRDIRTNLDPYLKNDLMDYGGEVTIAHDTLDKIIDSLYEKTDISIGIEQTKQICFDMANEYLKTDVEILDALVKIAENKDAVIDVFEDIGNYNYISNVDARVTLLKSEILENLNINHPYFTVYSPKEPNFEFLNESGHEDNYEVE
jgi:hypothetical protein